MLRSAPTKRTKSPSSTTKPTSKLLQQRLKTKLTLKKSKSPHKLQKRTILSYLKDPNAEHAPADPQFSTINADLDRIAQARQYPLCNITTLENGLRVASEKQLGDLISVAVAIDAGSRYENDDNNGTAHFLEHTLFKGTKNRTRTRLEMEIEQFGGSLNAFTSREQTVYTATFQKKHLPLAVEILGDVLLNSNISPSSIENERPVIIEEQESVAEDLQETIYDRFHQSCYRGQPLGYDILGPLKNIQKISKNDIDTYIKTHYTGPRMVVSVVGDVEHTEVQNLVQKHFAAVPNAPVNGINPIKKPANYIGSDIRIRDDDMPNVHLAIGFETAGWNDPDHYALMTLQMMLGTHHETNTPTDIYSSSDLIHPIAKNRWANSIQPFNTIYSDTGIFGLYAVAPPNKLDVLGDHMILSLVRHSTHVPEQLLREAKAKLQFSLLSQYEGTDNTVQELSRQILSHGRRIHPVEILHRVEQVDAAAVQNVVKRFFVDQDFTISAIGNTFELQDYALLRKKASLPFM